MLHFFSIKKVLTCDRILLMIQMSPEKPFWERTNKLRNFIVYYNFSRPLLLRAGQYLFSIDAIRVRYLAMFGIYIF